MFSAHFMHPGLQKKVKKKKNAESHRKFPLPRPSCAHSREKRPDGQWVEFSGEPAGMHERAFPPLLPWEPGQDKSRSSEQNKRCQCQDLCLAHRTLRQTRVGLEAGRKSEDELLDSCLLGEKNNNMPM